MSTKNGVLEDHTNVPEPPYDSNRKRDRMLHAIAHTMISTRDMACANRRWVRGIALAVMAAALAVLTGGVL